MITAIHQPNYMPWMGYFHKMYMADVFVILDNVQYTDTHEGRINWNTIKGANGRVDLIVPTKRTLSSKINEVRICDGNWRDKHLKSIFYSYKKAEHFDAVYPAIERLLNADYPNLAKMNEAIIRDFASRMGIATEIVIASDLGGLTDYKKERLVIEICKRVGADVYYSGNGAACYQQERSFTDEGIKLVYQDYRPLEYKQLWSGFEPNLSAVDYFMNNGFEIPSQWKKED